MVRKDRWTLDYYKYLKLDEVLSAQELQSAKAGEPVHTEMLFIIVHQVYELWFKLILHEVDSVIKMFAGDFIDERNIGTAVRRLQRVTDIQKLLIEQVRVIETMRPREFLDFRKLLGSASGFQSFQFRLLENKLGLLPEARIQYGNKPYYEDLSDEHKGIISSSEKEPNLFQVVERWLERTPFVKSAGFDFVEAYRHSCERVIAQERVEIDQESSLRPDERESKLKMVEKNLETFSSIFDSAAHQRLARAAQRRISHPALVAALFISLYRDEPILQLPFQLIESVIEIDENFALWRNRHALMVFRMIGRKVGTGESSGYDYLRRTIDSHRIFGDLFNLATYLIPKSELPKLPEKMAKNLAFHFSVM